MIGLINLPDRVRRIAQRHLVSKISDQAKALRYRLLVRQPYKERVHSFTELGNPQVDYIHSEYPNVSLDWSTRLAEGESPQEIFQDFIDSAVDSCAFENDSDVVRRFIQYMDRCNVVADVSRYAAFTPLRGRTGDEIFNDLLKKVEESEDEKVQLFLKLIREGKGLRISTTNHPTDFYTEDINRCIEKLVGIMKEETIERLAKSFLPNPIYGQLERLLPILSAKERQKTIKDLIFQLAQTKFRYGKRRMPIDEAHMMLNTVGDVFFDVLSRKQAGLNLFYERQSNQPINSIEHRPQVSFPLGSWECSDRDGNPYVTTKLTKQFVLEKKVFVLGKYLKAVRKLRDYLTFGNLDKDLESVDKKLLATLEFTKNKLTKYIEQDGIEYPQMNPSSDVYLSPEELVKDLLGIRKKVTDPRNRSTHIKKVEKLISAVELFGFHFTESEIRQNTKKHKEALDQIISLSDGTSYSDLEREEKLKVLGRIIDGDTVGQDNLMTGEQGLKISVKTTELDDEISRDIIDSLIAIDDIQNEAGQRACHTYIMSNTEDGKLNIRELLTLAKLAGHDLQKSKLEIVPLIETPDDLKRTKEIVENIADENDPYYFPLLKSLGYQRIMLGYSDSCIRAGFVAANWLIFKAKSTISDVFKRTRLDYQLFDGRGYSLARSGVFIEGWYRALRSEIGSPIQITVQGMGKRQYFRPETANYYVSKIATAGFSSKTFPDEIYKLTDKDRLTIEQLASGAENAFAQLRSDPAFARYVQNVTPYDFFIQHLYGSRPSKRTPGDTLDLEDLRAIPTVENFSQIAQKIFVFYGTGKALDGILAEKAKLSYLRDLYSKSTVFHNMIETIRKALHETNMSLTSHIKETSPQDYSVWEKINDEAILSEKLIRKILCLSETEPLIQGADLEDRKLREEVVLPAMVTQQYLKAKYKEAQEVQQLFEEMKPLNDFVGSIAGINNRMVMHNPHILSACLGSLTVHQSLPKIKESILSSLESLTDLSVKTLTTITNGNGQS